MSEQRFKKGDKIKFGGVLGKQGEVFATDLVGDTVVLVEEDGQIWQSPLCVNVGTTSEFMVPANTRFTWVFSNEPAELITPETKPFAPETILRITDGDDKFVGFVGRVVGYNAGDMLVECLSQPNSGWTGDEYEAHEDDATGELMELEDDKEYFWVFASGDALDAELEVLGPKTGADLHTTLVVGDVVEFLDDGRYGKAEVVEVSEWNATTTVDTDASHAEIGWEHNETKGWHVYFADDCDQVLLSVTKPSVKTFADTSGEDMLADLRAAVDEGLASPIVEDYSPEKLFEKIFAAPEPKKSHPLAVILKDLMKRNHEVFEVNDEVDAAYDELIDSFSDQQLRNAAGRYVDLVEEALPTEQIAAADTDDFNDVVTVCASRAVLDAASDDPTDGPNNRASGYVGRRADFIVIDDPSN